MPPKKYSALSLAISFLPTKREMCFAISVGTLVRNVCFDDCF